MKLFNNILKYILFICIIMGLSNCQPQFNKRNKIENFINIIQKNYIEEVEYNDLVEYAIKGIINELDSNVIYISSEEMAAFNDEYGENKGGIGINYDLINDTLVIINPIPGSPAEKAGILIGDMIIKIDGIDIIGLDKKEIKNKLLGSIGTKVKIDLNRPELSETLKFEITRETVTFNSIDASLINNSSDIGYINIQRFSLNTSKEIEDSLYVLIKKGMKKLIIDLRYNSGGYLNTISKVSCLFLNSGDTICYTKGIKKKFDEIYVCSENGKFNNIPIIILVNQNTDIGGEILSGAFQDLDRSLIVGNITNGSGFTTRQLNLGDGSVVRVPVSKNYLRSGRCLHSSSNSKDINSKFREEIQSKNIIDFQKEGYSIIKQLYKDSLPKLYKTVSERNMYDIGGVTPDFIIKNYKRTELTDKLLEKKILFTFSVFYYYKHKFEFDSVYKSDFERFIRNYEFSEEDIKKLISYTISQGITINNDEFNTDKTYILNCIKLLIAKCIWGANSYFMMSPLIDKQISNSINLFSESVTISRRYIK